MSGYCKVAPGHPYHGPYHDREYGFPSRKDEVLFERLALEINQAGLSWLTVLKKREALRSAFANFDLERVARFGVKDRARLMRDAGIIRNRLKIEAVIDNARRILHLKREYGSFAQWLDDHHPLSQEEWTRLFKKTFRFTGGEITREFLVSLGYLRGSHASDCPVAGRIEKKGPPWMGGRSDRAVRKRSRPSSSPRRGRIKGG